MRLQLALDVTDLDEAVAFYSRLFDSPPAKLEDGYANFAIEDPPLKLVLFEGVRDGTINHLGVEAEQAEEVAAAARRLEAAGLAPTAVAETTCCHADKVETWVHGPDGTRWEWYVKTADVPASPGMSDDGACCTPAAAGVAAAGADAAEGLADKTSRSNSVVEVADATGRAGTGWLPLSGGSVGGPACTLEAADVPERLAQAERLGVHLRGLDRDGNRLTLVVAPAGRTELVEFVRAESGCCSFLDFTRDDDEDELRLVVSAPHGGLDLLDDLHVGLAGLLA